MQFRIWDSAVTPSDAAEKNHNIGAQLQSLTCTTARKIFWITYFLYDFGMHKLIRSEPFLHYLYSVLTLTIAVSVI